MDNLLKKTVLKYHIVIRWPATCRNRSTYILQRRPDLVYKISEFTKQVVALGSIYKCPIQIDSNYNIVGLNTWWGSGEDLYHFLLNLKKYDMEVLPKIKLFNNIDSRVIDFDLKIEKNSVIVK
jgi:hypothetical protein